MEKPEGGRIDGKLFWQWTKENGHRISCGQAKRRFSNHYIILSWAPAAYVFLVRSALRLPTFGLPGTVDSVFAPMFITNYYFVELDSAQYTCSKHVDTIFQECM